MTPSAEQLRIFDWMRRGTGNLVVVARAGTGKTTTIIMSLEYAPERNIRVCAFNKPIEQELTLRIKNPRAKAQTLHSMGLRCVMQYWERVPISKSGERADDIAEKVCGAAAPDYIKRMVAKLHTKAREINPHARRSGELEDLQFKFDCIPDLNWARQGFDADYVERKALQAMDIAAKQKPMDTGIDFADMIFLPVRNGWMVPTYDMVIVDEAQDMTTAQLELATGMCKKNGRIVIVGDDRQAIYGFRGADSDSMARLKRQLNATELKLTTTYRCGKNIVAAAQRLVPDINAWLESPDGAVLDLDTSKLTDVADHGDFILSRTNAPLVSTAMALLRKNKRARIAGKDIGKDLQSLIRKLTKSRPNVEQFIELVNEWESKEVSRWALAKKEDRVERVRDQAEMLRELSVDADSVHHIEERIEALFVEDGRGSAGVIMCSSVHKAKGKEADRVFVLADTLRGHNIEEQNIEYVAITRAKKKLYMVSALGPVSSEQEQVAIGSADGSHSG